MRYRLDIDTAKADKRGNARFRGIGMVSANGSSRLLIDYRELHPQKYSQLMRYVFGREGLAVSHLKLELGSDVNSSSGTEPSVMRSRDEQPDVYRGAGFVLARDAKQINPELTLDILFWSEPRWVTDAPDRNAARYEWYIKTLTAAYEQLGLRFDYVSLVRNERAHDAEWIKYFVRRLRRETSLPYDPCSIRIVGGEEVCTWGFADLMLSDAELRGMIDVVGSHYTSIASESALELADKHGKELWFSEASSPMGYSRGGARLGCSGLAGVGGVLDIIDRFIAMYPRGEMTLCELQPIVAAYYDGVTYGYKQLIRACEPWSGTFTADTGFFAFLHISQFIRKGWCFMPGCCFNDGEVGGDGHALVNVRRSCMTLCSPDGREITAVITNSLSEPVVYSLHGLAGRTLGIWETVYGSEKRLFSHRADITAGETAEMTVEPYSVVTVSTVQPCRAEFPDLRDSAESPVMPLPYRDMLRYDGEMLRLRGGAPLYTTDQGGAFEIGSRRGQPMLIQQITDSLRAEEWGYTPEPVTSLGDDRWYDYSFSADIAFAEERSSGCYAGIGIRYALAAEGAHGLWIRLFADGRWELMKTHGCLLRGQLGKLDADAVHRLTLAAVGREVTALLDGRELCRYTEQQRAASAGRAALYSSFDRNAFAALEIQPLSEHYFVERFDCTDPCVSFSGDWQHGLTGSFRELNRTASTGGIGSGLEISFKGSSIALMGKTAAAELSVSIDGGSGGIFTAAECSHRERSLCIGGLSGGSHTLSVTVTAGSYTFEGFEVTPDE